MYWFEPSLASARHAQAFENERQTPCFERELAQQEKVSSPEETGTDDFNNAFTVTIVRNGQCASSPCLRFPAIERLVNGLALEEAALEYATNLEAL